MSEPSRPTLAGTLENRPAPTTVPKMFARTCDRRGDNTALLHKQGGAFLPITYRELASRVQDLAIGLHDMGVRHGDRVGILSENRPEWAIADLALLSIGAINVPLYSTLPPAQVRHILADSEVTVAIVSDEKQRAKIAEVRGDLPKLQYVVTMDPAEGADSTLSFSSVEARGREHSSAKEAFTALADAVQPQDVSSIIYTSGTTGEPKGAVLTHDNFMSNALAVIELVGITEEHRFLSYLPLSHVFERIAGHYLSLTAGASTAYAESIFAVATNMAEVQPTVMASVPRLYESIQSRVEDGIRKQPPARQRVARIALKIGQLHNGRKITGRPPGIILSLLYSVADRLILEKLRTRVFGGKLEYSISGGAPLPVGTAEFITAMGVTVLEGYGLTETSPVIAVNPPGRARLGTVGPPIPGVQVKIAPDGEILSRGPHIMKGYWNMPDATAEAIDSDGWFHTGDIGCLDPDGYLRITDRKKDIIVLANGKNVAPQPIEARLKQSSFIATAVLFGDRQSQVVALIVPDWDALKRWATEQGIEERSPEALIEDGRVKRLFRDEIEKQSSDLADYERVRRHALVPRDFSAERGEVTPTLKIRRKQVADNFSETIAGLYRSQSASA